MYPSQKQREISDAFNAATGRMVHRQFEEREGEAPRKAEVGDGMQWREMWSTRHPMLRQHPPPGPCPSIHSICTHTEGQGDDTEGKC